MVIRDLSEQKEYEQKLRSLYSRYEAILDSVPDIIMEVDIKKRYTWQIMRDCIFLAMM
jgi:PAS domain-containing protein